VLNRHTMEDKSTPVIKVRGMKSKEQLLEGLEDARFINQSHEEQKETIDWRRPGDASRVIQQRVGDYVKRDAERLQGRIYFLGGNLPNIFSGLARGNTGEALMGLFFAIPNFFLGFMKQEPRNADQLAEDAAKVFRDKDGKLDLQQGGRDLPAGPVHFGKLWDDFFNAMSGDEAPGHKENTPSRRFGFKTVFSLISGAMAIKGGLEGTKILMMDEDQNPVLDENGRPKYVTEKDGALIRSGVLITGAYGAPAFIASDAESGRPLTDFHAAGETINDNLPGGKAITETAGAAAGKLRNVPGIKQYVDAAQKNNVAVTGNLMSLHNVQQIGSALWQIGVSAPQQKQVFQMKMKQERQNYFGDQGRFTEIYLGEDGVFAGKGVDRLLDKDGNLTQEAVNAKNTIIQAYDHLKEQRDTLQKKDKKGKKPEVQSNIQRIEAQMEGMAASYERALFIGCYDLEDKTRRSGFLWRKREPGSAEKLRQWHEERYLGDAYASIEKGGYEETAFKAAISRERYQTIAQQPFLAGLRLQYSLANLTAAQVLKQINKSGPVEQNTAQVYLDQERLYDKLAGIVLEEITQRFENNQPVSYARIEQATNHLSEYIKKQRERGGLRENAAKGGMNVSLGVHLNLLRWASDPTKAPEAFKNLPQDFQDHLASELKKGSDTRLMKIIEREKAMPNQQMESDLERFHADGARASVDVMTEAERGKMAVDHRIFNLYQQQERAVPVI